MKFTRVGTQSYIDGTPVDTSTIRKMAEVIQAEADQAYKVWTEACAAEAEEYDRTHAKAEADALAICRRLSVPPIAHLPTYRDEDGLRYHAVEGAGR